jgi:UDP-glucose 4-epimerase
MRRDNEKSCRNVARTVSKILVTGASGLCGRVVCRELADHGYDVVALSRLARTEESGIEWVEYDLATADLGVLDDVCQRSVEAVIHFGAYVPLVERTARFEECFAVNVAGTLNLLRWALMHHVRKFVYASSCSVYGPLEQVATVSVDEDTPTNPNTYYSISKLCGERLVQTVMIQDELPATVLRIGYVYGLGLSRKRLVHRILGAVAAQQDLSLTNADKSIMHLINARDVARAARRAIAGPSGVFNLVHEIQPTLREAVRAAEEATGKRASVTDEETKPRRDPFVDVRRLKSQFGWSPETALVEGLAEIYREEY